MATFLPEVFRAGNQAVARTASNPRPRFGAKHFCAAKPGGIDHNIATVCVALLMKQSRRTDLVEAARNHNKCLKRWPPMAFHLFSCIFL